MYLLTTYIHNFELEALTILPLVSTLYKSLHAIQPAVSFTSRCLVTALNNGHSSASVLTLLSGEYPTTEVSTELYRYFCSASLAELN
jgi:hypothetical protein